MGAFFLHSLQQYAGTSDSPVETSLLIELISGIQYGAGSEVPFAFKDSIATHIIAFYGFKIPSWDAPTHAGS